jgi:hypothetical protein
LAYVSVILSLLAKKICSCIAELRVTVSLKKIKIEIPCGCGCQNIGRITLVAEMLILVKKEILQKQTDMFSRTEKCFSYKAANRSACDTHKNI